MGERTAIFFADGFEDCEGLITVDMFRRAGLRIDTISMNAEKEVHTSHGVTLFADTTFSGIDASDYDVLILPGGKKAVANLDASEAVKAAYRKHYEAGKLSGAICAAPSILGHMGLLRGKTYTCFPSFNAEYGGTYSEELAVTDGNLVTGRGMGATIEFARQLLMQLIDDETLRKVEYGMQYKRKES